MSQRASEERNLGEMGYAITVHENQFCAPFLNLGSQTLKGKIEWSLQKWYKNVQKLEEGSLWVSRQKDGAENSASDIPFQGILLLILWVCVRATPWLVPEKNEKVQAQRPFVSMETDSWNMLLGSDWNGELLSWLRNSK